MTDGLLGRRPPRDWRHVDNWPLAALAPADQPKHVPVVLGINWHSNFDDPELIGRTYWIGRGNLGPVRGGHAICALPHGVTEPLAWQAFYNQMIRGRGSCVGFSESRMMSLLNRVRYDAEWLYDEAQYTDEYADTPPEEGTSVRAGFRILMMTGHRRVIHGRSYPVEREQGIREFRWAKSWQEVRDVLGTPDAADGVPLLNSWGRSYPRIVRLTDEAGERLLKNEDGEAGVVTDR
jgi:hypothetical protein